MHLTKTQQETSEPTERRPIGSGLHRHTPLPRVLIVADNASARLGGEAVLPVHHFAQLLKLGAEVHLITHARNRAEISTRFAHAIDRIQFVPDTRALQLLHRLSLKLPRRIAEATLGMMMRMLSQREARRMARETIVRHRIDVIHQPTPVSPKEPSLLGNLGVPLVIGPMNGGMTYAPGFSRLETPLSRIFIAVARSLSNLVHVAIDGKRRAAVLLVSNERTKQALPRGCQGKVVELVENGVDLDLFSSRAEPRRRGRSQDQLRLIFVGRLVDWKALDVVLDAMAALGEDQAIHLNVVGDGPMRASWAQRAADLGLAHHVSFLGQLPQSDVPQFLLQSDVLVLPSVYECGGAVVLEAMAMGLPVIATDWGGPADYLSQETGILVSATSRASLVDGFSQAILKLAQEPQLAAQFGARARQLIRDEYSWHQKCQTMLGVYQMAMSAQPASFTMPSASENDELGNISFEEPSRDAKATKPAPTPTAKPKQPRTFEEQA